MRFRVGPYIYTVQWVAGYIRHEGENCLGLCDNEHHVLLISDQASPAQQIQVACHEYMEAWVYHFGANLTDKEDYCDLFGLAMTQFVLDFIRELRPWLRDDVDLSAHAFMRHHASLPTDAKPVVTKTTSQAALDAAQPSTAGDGAIGLASAAAPQATSLPSSPAPADGPRYRVTRIYEPAPQGSGAPWQDKPA